MFWVCILGSKITYIFKADNGNVEDCPWTRYAFLRVTDHKNLKQVNGLSHSFAHLVKKCFKKIPINGSNPLRNLWIIIRKDAYMTGKQYSSKDFWKVIKTDTSWNNKKVKIYGRKIDRS